MKVHLISTVLGKLHITATPVVFVCVCVSLLSPILSICCYRIWTDASKVVAEISEEGTKFPYKKIKPLEMLTLTCLAHLVLCKNGLTSSLDCALEETPCNKTNLQSCMQKRSQSGFCPIFSAHLPAPSLLSLFFSTWASQRKFTKKCLYLSNTQF